MTTQATMTTETAKALIEDVEKIAGEYGRMMRLIEAGDGAGAARLGRRLSKPRKWRMYGAAHQLATHLLGEPSICLRSVDDCRAVSARATAALRQREAQRCSCTWADDAGDPEVGPDPYISEPSTECPIHGAEYAAHLEAEARAEQYAESAWLRAAEYDPRMSDPREW